MRRSGRASQDLLQDERDAARLADAGGAEHGEMLAQHFVDVDVGADRCVLLEVADVDRVRARDVVDEAQSPALIRSAGSPIDG